MLEALADRPATKYDCENEFGFSDLEFVCAPTVQYGSAGTPWTKWVPIGMPKIPQDALRVAFYLYPSVESAQTGGEFGGTGFFVSVPSEVEGQMYIHAVTNWHVAVKNGFSVLRVNRLDGTPEIFDAGPEDWIFDPKLDIAVLPMALNPEVHSFKAVPASMLATEEWVNAAEVGPGDDIFMVGRFVDHDGGPINSPSVRFGNISTKPTPVEQPNGKMAPSYCLDMHSRTGYSGSPVFVFRTMGQDLTAQNVIGVGGASTFLTVLGIHYAQFPEAWEIAEGRRNPQQASSVPLVTEGKYVVGLSGMTLALPAWRIMDVLNLPKLKTAREANDKILRMNRSYATPVAEVALPEAEIAERRDAGLRRALNTAPQPRSKSE